MLCILRLLLIVTTIFGLPAYGSGITLSSWYALINFCIIGFSNGICGTYVMMKGTGETQLKEVGGYIMAFHLTIGLALGSVFASVLANILL
jgi:hypothetical protein